MKHKSLSQMNREKRIDRDRGTSPAVLRSSGPKQRPERVATTLGVSDGESIRRDVPADEMKPMTLQEEYRNADVPMPNDLLDASNTEEFKYNKKQTEEYVFRPWDDLVDASNTEEFKDNKNVFKDKTISDDYKSGGAYRALLKMFHNNLKEENDNNKKRSKRV